MTNGEKIKEIFPNITERFTNIDEYTNKPTRVEISVGMHILTTISADVWNAEYKEPATKNNLGVGAISRQALYDALYERFHEEDTNNITNVTLGSVRNFVKDFPSVTPIRPKGYWIWVVDETPSTPVSSYELDYAGWVCSCCREIPDDICEWDNPDEPPTYKFCPNCGADMRESEDKDDKTGSN